MKADAEIFEILTEYSNGDKEKADKVFDFFASKSTARVEDLRQVFLTKDDKIELLVKIQDAERRVIYWLIGLFMTIGGIVIALLLNLTSKIH